MIQMKQIVIILTIALLTFNCANRPQTNNKNTDEPEDAGISYLETLVDRENIKVILRWDSLGYWSVIYTIGKDEQVLNLNKEGIPQKTPELAWANEDYACIITWWSQAQGRHIFIPLKKENKFIYLNKNIERMDSINNNIVYIDAIYDHKDEIIFAAENLLTRKNKKTHPFIINEHNSVYPFFDSITMTKDRVMVVTGAVNQTIDISGLYEQQST